MGFLSPVLGPLIGAGGAVAGGLLGSGQSKEEKQLLQQQTMTEQDQRNLMDQYAKLQQQYGTDAANFYLQYMAQGNPFIRNLISQHFGQIGQQYGNQQGLLSQKIAAQGFGAAPSGIAAASAGDLSRAEAGTQSESWLNDMLQNEQIKFQAAQGLGGIANMFQPGQFALHRFSNPQAPPNPFTQVPGAIGNLLQSIPGGNVMQPSYMPGGGPVMAPPNVPMPMPSGGPNIPGLFPSAPQMPQFGGG